MGSPGEHHAMGVQHGEQREIGTDASLSGLQSLSLQPLLDVTIVGRDASCGPEHDLGHQDHRWLGDRGLALGIHILNFEQFLFDFVGEFHHQLCPDLPRGGWQGQFIVQPEIIVVRFQQNLDHGPDGGVILLKHKCIAPIHPPAGQVEGKMDASLVGNCSAGHMRALESPEVIETVLPRPISMGRIADQAGSITPDPTNNPFCGRWAS